MLPTTKLARTPSIRRKPVASSCLAFLVFPALVCVNINNGVICKETPEARMETSIRPNTVETLTPFDFYFYRDVDIDSVTEFFYGRVGKSNRSPIDSAVKQHGCIIKTHADKYYFEFQCKEFRR